MFAADTLLLRAEAEASIAFVSSVTFSGDGHAVLAVGGDANCYVHELAPRGRSRGCVRVRSLLTPILPPPNSLLAPPHSPCVSSPCVSLSPSIPLLLTLILPSVVLQAPTELYTLQRCPTCAKTTCVKTTCDDD